MNRSRMLIDSSDSLGDEDEGGGDVPYYPQEHDMSWEDAVVSDEDDECEENEDGVLILPSHDASSSAEEQISSSFSIPDSVPSDVHSVQISTDDTRRRMPVQQVTLTLYRNNHNPGEEDDSDDEPDLLSDSASCGAVNVHATVLIRGETTVQESSPRVSSIWAQVTAVVVLVFLTTSLAYLVHDRHQLQTRVRLEAELHQEQIRRLREDHEAQLAAALEEERLASQQKSSSTTPPKTRFFWETDQDPKTPVMDNCWAQVKLRQRSLETATTVKKHVASMAQSALETTKGLYTQVKKDVPSIEEWWSDVIDTTKGLYTQVKNDVPYIEEWWIDVIETTKGQYTQVKKNVPYFEDWWNDASAKSKEEVREQQQSRHGESSSSPHPKTKSTDNHQKRESQADQHEESSSSNQNEESSSSATKENEKNKMGNFKAVGKAVLTTVAVGALATVLTAGLEVFYSDINGDTAGEYTRSMPDL